MKFVTLSLTLLLLVTTLAVCSHTVSPQHEKHCSICAAARLQGEVPATAPVLAALAASFEEIFEYPIQQPPVTPEPGNPCRAPPQPTVGSSRLQ